MARTIEDLLAEAVKLPTEQRAHIVAELLTTLEPDTPGIHRSDDEWIREIERRARAAAAGTVSLSWSEARTETNRRLRSR